MLSSLSCQRHGGIGRLLGLMAENDASWEPVREGDSVEFEVAEGPKGLNAVKVSKTE